MTPLFAPASRPTTHRADAVRAGVVLLAAIAQLLTPVLPSLGVGVPIGTRSALAQTPVTPAGYAFAIWSYVYLACLVYAVWQALPAQRERELHRRVGPWLAAAFALNALWPAIVQSYGLVKASVLTIAAILYALLGALDRARALAPRGSDFWLLRVPVGVFAGWITAAAFANLSATLRAQGYVEAEATTAWVAVYALAAAFVAYAVARVRGEWAYVFAIAWAGVALLSRNYAERPASAEMGAAIGLLLVLAGTVGLERARSRMRDV